MLCFTITMAGYTFSSHSSNRPGKLPKGYHQKLIALKKLSQKLNRLIEEGTFYKYPYFQRRKEVQKLTRLYRGLLGRVESSRLKHILAASVVLVGGGSCGLEDIKAGIASRLGNTPPEVTIAEGDVRLENGAEQTFTAAVTDPDADNTHTYTWYVEGEEQPDAAENAFSFSRTPWEETDYSVTVVVSDGTDTGEDSVTASVERNIVSPSFNAYQVNPFGLSPTNSYINPEFADIDGDGDLDLFLGNWGNAGMGHVYFHENIGTAESPQFSANSSFDIYSNGYKFDAALGDIDNDGDYDVLIGAQSANDINFIQNDGSSANPVWTPISGPTSPFYNLFTVFGIYDSDFSPGFVDIDNDGDLDLFVGARYYNIGNPLCKIWFFENTGTASAPAFTYSGYNQFGLTIPSGAYDYPIPHFVDIDNDGDYDCFVGDITGNLHFFENTGDAENPDFTGWTANNAFPNLNTGVYSRNAVTFADIDEDGDMDLFVGAYYYDTTTFTGYNRILYFENTSAP